MDFVVCVILPLPKKKGMMNSNNISPAESDAAIEETKRLCNTAHIEFGIDTDERRLPALCVDLNFGDRALYEQCDVMTVWTLAHDKGRLRAVFFDVEFLGTGTKFKVCF